MSAEQNSGPARRVEDLVVWQKSHQLVLETYRASARFPASERYGLTCQLRRAAVSVPANIAEGFRRHGRADKARLLNIAQGSLAEAEYYLILATDLGYADLKPLLKMADEVSRILGAYVRALRTGSESQGNVPAARAR